MDPLLDLEIVGDFDYLSRKQGRDIYAEMVGRLAQSWPERLRQLQDARSQGSTTMLSHTLHALKGMAASLGLRQLAAQAGAAEQAARAGAIDIDLVGLTAIVEQSLAAARRQPPA